jgi:hypothetical protein
MCESRWILGRVCALSLLVCAFATMGAECWPKIENPGDTNSDSDSPGTGGQATPGDDIEELSFFEEELVGKWYRYHGYDDSGRYKIFNVDRTACKWEEPSSGGRIHEVSYVYWGLVESTEDSNVFNIAYQSVGGELYVSGDEYHYAEDEIWTGGYSNLRMYRSSTWKDCGGTD